MPDTPENPENPDSRGPHANEDSTPEPELEPDPEPGS